MSILWRIELLGRLRLQRAGQVITHFDTRKTSALLACLAFFPDRLHSRELLAETLWPEEESEVTRSRLRQALAVLRRALEPSDVLPNSVLIASRTEVGWVPETITTDVEEFEDALKAVQGEMDPAEQVKLFDRAVELYGGALLPGFYEEWIAPERERLADLYREALRQGAALRASLGDLAGAIACARRTVNEDPLEEETHRDLIRLYLKAGRRNDAFRQYRELERHLREAFGGAPSPDTRELLTSWRGHSETAAEPLKISPPAPFPEERLLWHEPEGGAVPLESVFYIVRPTDEAFTTAIARRDSIVLVKGAREIGKTSLLARGVQEARKAGAQVVLTDLQTLTAAQMASADTLFLSLAEAIVEQLEIDLSLDEVWNPKRGWNVNFEKFLRREVLGKLETPLVWAIDEVDRLFTCSYSTEVFGLFRSWHNQRALNPSGPWGKFTLAIAYATEAHLFITDLNQSPFNVGTRLSLEDFTLEQVMELNCLYGEPLRDRTEVERFYGLVGGRPALARRGLHEMTSRHLDIAAVEAEAEQEDGLFGNHLRRMLQALRQDAALCEALRGLLRGQPLPSEESFYRLHSAGLVTGKSAQGARMRCLLYQRYLERRLV